ncbi:electron transfer flavoprotein subunit beta/FixA family protein [Myxococcota bacterium]|nr:electron transfer flavoprotein subunit beta/FixA family protein [Myxococcota bacterium]MBU1534544.1 electron transfer flavoprotein subunit beta/FixA family protein [Myxococcota bacterium]
MKIIVCVKQVPDTNDVKTDVETGRIIREGVVSMVNPDDRHAMEEALRLRQKHGGSVIALSMGPMQAKNALMQMLAMGADEGYLLCDPLFAGSDTWATAYALGTCIQHLGLPDVILCGRQATDGDTAQVGPQLAEYLGIPQVTQVRAVVEHGAGFRVEAFMEEGYRVVKVAPPLLLTVSSECNQPRYPNMIQIVQAHRKKKVTVLSAADIGALAEFSGLNGSPTRVKRVFVPAPPPKGELFDGPPHEAVEAFIMKLKEYHLVPS